jgi:hypothetical protein
MKEPKKFRILDFNKFLNRNLNTKPDRIFDSRRSALKKMSLFLLGANPLIRTIDKTLAMPFMVRKQGRALCFFYDGEVSWVIDPDKFGRNAEVKFKESKGGFTISLTDAEYPSTGIAADFNASITNDSGNWMMDIVIPGLRISENISFSSWLRENKKLRGAMRTDLRLSMGSHDYLHLPSPCLLTLDRNWDINFKPAEKVLLKVFNGDEYFRYVKLSLYSNSIPSWISPGYFKQATCISLLGAQSRFMSFGSLGFKSRRLFNAGSYPFSRTGIITGSTASGPAKLLWASGNEDKNGPAEIQFAHDNESSLSLHQSRFYKEYTGHSEPFLFAADLGDKPQWVGTGGASFALASSPDSSFIVYGEGVSISRLDLRAQLVQSRINVDGASSLPAFYTPSFDVQLLPQDRQALRPQAVRPGQVLNPLNIQRQEDQDNRGSWLYIDKEASRIRFRTDRSIIFNLIRPNDFLCLQLEYVNFLLDGNLLKIDDRKMPSFLIVHFQSQHTREEMFREKARPVVPAAFCRAGSSRIVLKVPSDNLPVPLTLDQLLNWDNFEIQVNYRARWFNSGLVQGGLIRESLRKISMVFSASPQKRKDFVRSPGLNLPKPIPHDRNPISAQELKIALAASPKGVGRMGLSDESLGLILSNPVIETTLVASLRGAMQNLFQMGPPSIYETSIEAPSWLEVSPNQFAGFAHTTKLRDEFGEFDETSDSSLDISDETTARQRQVNPSLTERQISIQPGTNRIGRDRVQVQGYRNIITPGALNIPSQIFIKPGQLFELWHSRLGNKLANGEIDEDNLNELKTVRALWSNCASEKLSQKHKKVSGTGKNFHSLPEPPDFHDIVHLTSNYTELRIRGTETKADPKPIRVKRLILSGLGAWFSYEFRDDREIEGASLQAWLQRATTGRDHYVKLVKRGYLFPFGHKAVHVNIAERKIQLIGNTYSAIIIEKEYVILKQPELYYDSGSGTEGFIPFPFQRVEIKEAEVQVMTAAIIPGQEIYELHEIINPGKPVQFKIEADDASGNKIRFVMPLVFINGRVKDQSAAVKYYTGNGWHYFRSSQTSGPVAYARSLIPGDTAFETSGITFGARAIGYELDGVRFYPEVNEASVFVKQIEELTGERKEVRIQLMDDNNLSMVFARIHKEERAALVFGSSETSGGFLTPNMAVTGFSRLTGLTGNDISNPDKLVFSAEKLFSLSDNIPKIFGVINFIDILEKNIDLTGAATAIKNKIEQVRNGIEHHMQEILSAKARADNEIKLLDRFLQLFSGMLDKGIVGIFQDMATLVKTLTERGIAVSQGTLAGAIDSAMVMAREIQSRGVKVATLTGYIGKPAELKAYLEGAGVQLSPLIIENMLQLVAGLYKDGFEDREIMAVVNLLGLAYRITDLQSQVKKLSEDASSSIIEAIPEMPNVKFHVKGDEIIAEYHWRPRTVNNLSTSVFTIRNLNPDASRIDVSVDCTMVKSTSLKTPPVFNVNASINRFTVIVAKSLQINFERLSFRSSSGSAANIDLKFMAVPIRLTGSLSFVNSLQKVIKADQFSGGPFLDVSSDGVAAGYNFPLPNIEVGILSLSNMMLGTRLNLPFNNEPFTMGFNFSSRENPFRVLVSCFGGGGFFNMESSMNGLTRMEAAFEFGAGIALDVGVASGSVEAMGGIYYGIVIEASGNSCSIAAYLRVTGRLSILKMIRVTLEFYLEMNYEPVGGQKEITEGGQVITTVDRGSRLTGTASLMVRVEVAFFSKTVKVTVQRTLTGNDADPKFAETFTPEHWRDYCTAFAS